MSKPLPLNDRFDAFERQMRRLLLLRCCDCELGGLDALITVAHRHFVAARPHLEQLERGITRAELGELQLALIDKAHLAVVAISILVTTEVGMEINEPERLARGRRSCAAMLLALEPYMAEAEGRWQRAVFGPLERPAEVVAIHAN